LRTGFIEAGSGIRLGPGVGDERDAEVADRSVAARIHGFGPAAGEREESEYGEAGRSHLANLARLAVQTEARLLVRRTRTRARFRAWSYTRRRVLEGRILLCAAIATSSCVPSLALDPPPMTLPDGRPASAAILILTTGDTIERMFAVDLVSDPILPSLGTVSKQHSKAYALLYDRALTAMNLKPGEVEIGAAGSGVFLYRSAARKSGGGASFPGPASSFLLPLSSAHPTWSMVQETDLPTAVFTLRAGVMPLNTCVTFSATAMNLGSDQPALLAAPLDAHSALVATWDGRFFEVTSSTVTRLTKLSTTTPHLSAFRDTKGTLWMIGQGGRVVRGDPMSGFVPVTRNLSARASQFMFLAGPRDQEAFELFSAGDDGSFERFDGTTWQRFDSINTPFDADYVTNYAWRAGVAWLGPNEAVAVLPKVTSVLHVVGGTLKMEPIVGSGDTMCPTALDWIPAFGPVVGIYTGQLFVKDSDTWTEILGTPYDLPVTMISPLGDGILFGGPFGTLAQYHPDYGYCAPQGYGPDHIRAVIPFEDGYLLALYSGGHGASSTSIVLLHRLN
jgi:hypothetical protein